MRIKSAADPVPMPFAVAVPSGPVASFTRKDPRGGWRVAGQTTQLDRPASTKLANHHLSTSNPLFTDGQHFGTPKCCKLN